MLQKVKQEQLKVSKIKDARELMYSEREEARKLGGKEGIALRGLRLIVWHLNWTLSLGQQ